MCVYEDNILGSHSTDCNIGHSNPSQLIRKECLVEEEEEADAAEARAEETLAVADAEEEDRTTVETL